MTSSNGRGHLDYRTTMVLPTDSFLVGMTRTVDSETRALHPASRHPYWYLFAGIGLWVVWACSKACSLDRLQLDQSAKPDVLFLCSYTEDAAFFLSQLSARQAFVPVRSPLAYSNAFFFTFKTLNNSG